MTVMAPRPRVKPAPTGVVVAQAGVTVVARPNAIAVHPTAVLFRCPFISPYLLIPLSLGPVRLVTIDDIRAAATGFATRRPTPAPPGLVSARRRRPIAGRPL